MNIGRLRNLITFRRPVSVRDEFGGDTPTFLDVTKAWADITPLSAREVDVARGFSPSVSHAIRIRFVNGIDTTQEISFGTRVFAVNGIVDPDGRRRELNVYATELVK